MSFKIGRANKLSIVLFVCVLSLLTTGCGSADPTASLSAGEAAAVKSLAALNAKTHIRDGHVTYVDFNSLTDAAAASIHLKDLPHIEKLNFSSTNMSDAALANLAGLAELKELGLWGTQVTDNGLAHLAGHSKLELLNVNETNVTDAGLEHLKNLTAIKKLYLNGAKVSDAGLAHLAGLKQLVWVDAFGTSVTPAGAAEFREQHPNVEVVASEDGDVVVEEQTSEEPFQNTSRGPSPGPGDGL